MDAVNTSHKVLIVGGGPAGTSRLTHTWVTPFDG
jgi:NADPH-dependent glutamate synthase beta subunit-like oxidoreductase